MLPHRLISVVGQKEKCCGKGHVNVQAVSSKSTGRRQRSPDRHEWSSNDRTVSWQLTAERRCCRDAVTETGAQCTARYCGAVSSWHRRIITDSLHLKRSGTSSQWRSAACCSCDRPRSNFLATLTSRAGLPHSTLSAVCWWQTLQPWRRQRYSSLPGTSRKRARMLADSVQSERRI